jgi:MerR family transcriptional regulator, light-induced transcriptional regulator
MRLSARGRTTLVQCWGTAESQTWGPVYRIRHAAKLAGINPTLLRAWERRYHLVQPSRTPSGYRVYSSEDIEVLRAAARLVAAGHSISEVARLPRDELARRPPGDDGAGRADLPAWAGEAGGDGDRASLTRVVATEEDLAGPLAEALAAVAAFDRTRFEAALFPLHTSAGLGPVAFCERALLPLLRAIGDAWERGDLSVAAEHFGSALCRAKILQYLEFLARGAGGPRVVCACLEDELHEGGLLAFAVHAAAAHWQVIYLGAHTPLAQTLATAGRIQAAMVAISLTSSRRAAEVEGFVRQIQEARKDQPALRVVVGGRAALQHRQALTRGGAEVAESIGIALPAPPAAQRPP